MDSAKNVWWIIPFKKFGTVRVKKKAIRRYVLLKISIYSLQLIKKGIVITGKKIIKKCQNCHVS